MAVSGNFLEYIFDLLSAWGGVSSRRMFGGAGLYRNGKMFGLVADDVVYLKVDDSNREQFVAEGSKPFQPFPQKPATMSYYDVPPDVIENSEVFITWSQESLAIQTKQK